MVSADDVQAFLLNVVIGALSVAALASISMCLFGEAPQASTSVTTISSSAVHVSADYASAPVVAAAAGAKVVVTGATPIPTAVPVDVGNTYVFNGGTMTGVIGNGVVNITTTTTVR